MSSAIRDRIAGSALFAVALVWVGLVYMMVPTGQGTPVGPRAFPLWLGMALAGLSLALFLQSFREGQPAPAGEGEKDAGAIGAVSVSEEAFCIALTIGLAAVYATFVEQLGFLPSTPLFLAAAMVLLLRITAPLFVAAMSLGLTVGSYILFAKLLGTYLPPGTWITLRF